MHKHVYSSTRCKVNKILKMNAYLQHIHRDYESQILEIIAIEKTCIIWLVDKNVRKYLCRQKECLINPGKAFNLKNNKSKWIMLGSIFLWWFQIKWYIFKAQKRSLMYSKLTLDLCYFLYVSYETLSLSCSQ